MFKVVPVYNSTLVKVVYAVQQLENGLTQFLLFDEYSQKWLWMPASQYVPYAEPPKKKRKQRQEEKQNECDEN